MNRSATGYLRWLRERWRISVSPPPAEGRGAVVLLLFHGLFQSRKEAGSGACDPQQGITVEFFAQLLESLLAHGVAIRGLEETLDHPSPGLTAVVTFDDGYFNNVRALEVLERLGIPAVFFISTRHVAEQKSFWWDALYREARRRGASPRSIRREIHRLKGLRAGDIEARIVGWFGARALMPVADCDRPFTESELAAFARSGHVCLGNHTSDHAILVNYEPEGIRAQIGEAQRYLARIGGRVPRSIAYPNGDYDARIVAIARDEGLEYGVTVRTGLNLRPKDDPMELKRLTVWGTPGVATQVRALAALARALGGA